MLVYGERVVIADARDLAERLADDFQAVAALPPGLDRHGALAGCLIAAGQIGQGLADRAFEDAGWDDAPADAGSAMAATLALARLVWASWRGDRRLHPVRAEEAIRLLKRAAPPADVVLKSPEGYAFYAVYPEAYWQAARSLGLRRARVIGLRSIGASLAAMAGAALGDGAPLTLRPVGHPFDRQYRISPRLEYKLRATPGPVVIADEGPGLSGASFCAAGERLEALGIERSRQVFLPSHPGAPGQAATPERRERWQGVRRACVTFDDLAPGGFGGLVNWFEDLVGPAVAPLEDLSAGAWRRRRDLPGAPVFASQERRKFLLRTDRGDWLLKFAGLGDLGRVRFDRARRLAEAGFTPPVLAWRHGFTAQPWIDAGAPGPADRAAMRDRLAGYLGFRARALPAAPEAGAPLAELIAMARHNIAAGLGPEGAGALAALSRWASCSAAPVRVRTDNRLHAWEWLRRSDGVLWKTDAIDHDDAHDLVGCQDIAWDIAGARAEFELDAEETAQLCRCVEARCARPVDPALLGLSDICYAAFQLGYWTMARDAAGEADRPAIEAAAARYAARLRRLGSGAEHGHDGGFQTGS